jgi:hypothetical protein
LKQGAEGSTAERAMNEISKDYDDNYSGCLRTYATLRIYPGEIHPQEVTARLNVTPSKFWVRDADAQRPGAKTMHGWFLTTHGRLDSRDTRRHIDVLLAPLLDVAVEVAALQRDGAAMDIVCFWHAAAAQGGPALALRQLQALAQLNIPIAWNIYHG